ncbi:MAG: (E)-4-hydroxy-3-methylbut-2-enyl-diphosphate synthase [Bacteroidales bacterium]|jgi:(E)-4-hydroxy-3-methylbut-2-enyl-diphosphate synthase|nr:(E)-4-hydroxy-3-methylbut-2-enyl-diphosphate synthase [Bacteroidales bacterium]
MNQRYCIDLANYERFPSRVVMIGDIPLGGGHPIRLQSMTNTNTMDLKATVAQSKRIFDAGADFVRITTPGIEEAKFLSEIKKQLHKDGYKKPLIADVHFNPKAAEIAAEIVEKVRINPGNYVDPRARFKQKSMLDSEYKQELERMHERLLPLIRICKENGTAIRIGSNYGSLSDRIMNRYGNTAEGMVEAAMEFYRIFHVENFTQLVLSMKASNPAVMVKACRLLNARMMDEGVSFPQHLGVTEAGEGEDGRLRSALGIGALLSDGIGDTIRVSLTEAPEKEIPVAQSIVETFINKQSGVYRMPIYAPFYDAFQQPDRSNLPYDLKYPIVVADLRKAALIDTEILKALAYTYDKEMEIWLPGKRSPEMLIVTKRNSPMQPVKAHLFCEGQEGDKSWCKTALHKAEHITAKSNPEAIECQFDDFDEYQLAEICENHKPLFFLNANSEHPIGELRAFLLRLGKYQSQCPVFFNLIQNQTNPIQLASNSGAILIENQIAGVMFQASDKSEAKAKNQLAWDMLQSAGTRRTKVEFISCPGCGRTLFDLENTVQKIKEAFGHLGELKIAVMGCIVNGPGEMLDADYGYIGAGNGKVSLYKGQNAVLKNIPESEAVEALTNLMKKHNDWKEA